LVQWQLIVRDLRGLACEESHLKYHFVSCFAGGNIVEPVAKK
jgi:hypothetical protein